MSMEYTQKSGTGLIAPKALPDHLLQELTHEQIRDIGYYLFEQLVAQRDTTRREIKEVRK